MQADKKEPAAAAPAAGKPPSICDRLQRAFHARPAFRPLRRLTVRHHDGGAAKPDAAGAGAAPGPAPKHSGPPQLPLTPSPAPVGGAPAPTAPAPALQPVPVRAPAVTPSTSNSVAKKAAATSAPPGPPVPVPPPDVTAGMAPAADAKSQQTKGSIRVGSRVRKALSSK